MAIQSERELEKQVLQWLGNLQSVIRAIAQDSDKISARKFSKGNNKKGVLDVHVWFRGGRSCDIELKHGKNTCTPEQLDFIRQLTEEGHLAFSARSVIEIKAYLKECGIDVETKK